MSKSILIASPNTDLGELLRLSLEESSQYDIRMARTAGAVWEIMNSVLIDLVILDTDLIEKEISLFVQHLLEKQSSLRYLLIPPQNNPQHPSLAGLYPDGYVTRPFFVEDVITHIERLIGAASETLEPVEEEPASAEDMPPVSENPFEDQLLESFLKDDIEDTQPTMWDVDQPTPLLLDKITPLPEEETLEENASLDDFEAIFLDDYLSDEEEPQEDISIIELTPLVLADEPLDAAPETELQSLTPAEEPLGVAPETELQSLTPAEEPPDAAPGAELQSRMPADEPVEIIPDTEHPISIPADEPQISIPIEDLPPELEPAEEEKNTAIPLASLPPLEPDLPPAPLDLALSIPDALQGIHLEPEFLMALQQEVDAYACLVCDAAGVYAYSGELNSEDCKHITSVLRHHIDFDTQSGLAHFLNIGLSPLETLLYAINLIEPILLVVLFNVDTPISRAHTLTGNVRRRLLGEPASNLEETSAELAMQTEAQTALAELLAMMPSPQPEDSSTPDEPPNEITSESTDEISPEQPIIEESIELPEWAILRSRPSEPETPPPAEETESQPEPLSNPPVFETEDEPVDLELPDWAIPQPLSTIIEEEPQPIMAVESLETVEPQPAVAEPQTVQENIESQSAVPEPQVVQEIVDAQPEPVHEPEPNPIIDNIVFPWDVENYSPAYDAVVLNVEAENQGTEKISSNNQSNPGQTDQSYSCVLVPARSENLLTGDASKHLERWMPELCTSFGWQMTNLTIQPDYMLWSIVVPPTVSTGSLVNRIREYTSQKIVENIPQFRAVHSHTNFWAPTSLTVRGGHTPSQKAIDDLIQQAQRRSQPTSTP